MAVQRCQKLSIITAHTVMFSSFVCQLNPTPACICHALSWPGMTLDAIMLWFCVLNVKLTIIILLYSVPEKLFFQYIAAIFAVCC